MVLIVYMVENTYVSAERMTDFIKKGYLIKMAITIVGVLLDDDVKPASIRQS